MTLLFTDVSTGLAHMIQQITHIPITQPDDRLTDHGVVAMSATLGVSPEQMLAAVDTATTDSGLQRPSTAQNYDHAFTIGRNVMEQLAAIDAPPTAVTFQSAPGEGQRRV